MILNEYFQSKQGFRQSKSEQIKKFQIELEKFQQKFQDCQDSHYYIISTFWLDQQFYHELQNSTPYNEDLLLKVDNDIQLNPNINSNNFIPINDQIMQIFFANYDGYVILRPSYIDEDGQKQIEIYAPNILKSIDTDRNQQLLISAWNFSSFWSFAQFKESFILPVQKFESFIQKQSQEKYNSIQSYKKDSNDITNENIRIWKLKRSTDNLFEDLKKQCNASKTYEYKLIIQDQLLEENEDLKSLQNSFLIIDIKQQYKQWNLLNENETFWENCESCKKFIKLVHKCDCLKVSYCSDECKQKDYLYHSDRCEKVTDDTEQVIFQLKNNSKKGLTGLHNLGNTCYMNSAIQCLSNCDLLTQYFIENKYIEEINLTNILGFQGKIAKSYAKLLYNLWIEDKDVYVPQQFKKTIQQLNPMVYLNKQFQGYQQHDSCEILSYILDGLHEDLNRVIQKPYIENIDSNERPDEVVSQESWDNHLKRNKSVIVDLMHGQFKSRIKCPLCNIISNCFDPFMICPLPIPQTKQEKLLLYYLSFDNRQKAYKINLKFNLQNHPTAREVKSELCQLLEIEENKVLLAFLSYKDVEQIIYDDLSSQEILEIEKSKNLFAVEITQDDLQNRIIVPVRVTKTKSFQNYKEDLTFTRPFFFDINQNLKTIHQKIFSSQKFIFEENNQQGQMIKQMNDQEAWENVWRKPLSKPFKILIQIKLQGDQGISIDQQEFFPDDQISFKQFIQNIQQNNNQISYQFELNWSHPESSNLDLSKYNSCTDFHKKQEERQINIYDCLELFRQENKLSKGNEWYCPKCKEQVQAEKKMDIYKVPQVLIIQLKRFKGSNYSNEKNYAKVNFPIENFKLTDYVQQICQKDDYMQIEDLKIDEHQIIYDLFGVVNHFGQMGFGHYTAFIKNSNSKSWWQMNDSNVSEELILDRIVTENAYILFYQKRN